MEIESAEVVAMTPGQLVQAVSLAMHVPEETIVQHDRNLAIGGLRTMGGRGRSAPTVTPIDAARLLVATLGSMRNKDSVATVKAFEQTTYELPASLEELTARLRNENAVLLGREPAMLPTFTRTFDPVIDGLPPDHNFIEGVAALIEEASGPVGDRAEYRERFANIFIRCESSPFLRGSIGSKRVVARYRPKEGADKKAGGAETSELGKYAAIYGVFQERRAPGSAMILLGRAFREDGLNFKSTQDTLREFWSGPKNVRENSKVKARGIR
jgi:hypothetical protein